MKYDGVYTYGDRCSDGCPLKTLAPPQGLRIKTGQVI